MTTRTTEEAETFMDEVEAAAKRLTLHERMLAVVREASYVHRDVSGGAWTAASYDQVISKLRPFLLKHGILVYPDHASFRATPNGNTVLIEGALRFVNVDAPQDFIVVPSCSMGTQNAGGQQHMVAGLQTYIYKQVLRFGLLLETGDDPDFEAARGGAEVPPEIQQRIDRVMELALTKHGGDKEATDAYVRNVLDGIAKQYSRPRILSLAGLKAGTLDDWLKKLGQVSAFMPAPAPRGNGAKTTDSSGNTFGPEPPTDAEIADASPAAAQEMADEAREELERRQAAAEVVPPTASPPRPLPPAPELDVPDRVPKIIAWLSEQRPSIPQGNIRNAFGGWMFHAKHTDRRLADDDTWATIWGKREEILADLDQREKTRAKA